MAWRIHAAIARPSARRAAGRCGRCPVGDSERRVSGRRDARPAARALEHDAKRASGRGRVFARSVAPARARLHAHVSRVVRAQSERTYREGESRHRRPIGDDGPAPTDERCSSARPGGAGGRGACIGRPTPGTTAVRSVASSAARVERHRARRGAGHVPAHPLAGLFATSDVRGSHPSASRAPRLASCMAREIFACESTSEVASALASATSTRVAPTAG